MKADKEYWGSLVNPPLAPSDQDVEFFKLNMIKGTSLLLGCTRKLIPITTAQMDEDPWYESKTVIKKKWELNDTFYNNIIADGSLNLNKKLCDDIVKMSSKNCERLIVRSFIKKLDIMRIASHFPTSDDFDISPSSHIELNGSNFFIWNF
jgi:hypothetical protein